MNKETIIGCFLNKANVNTIRDSLFKIQSGLNDFVKKTQNQSINEVFKNKAVNNGADLDGWTLPDAIWKDICKKHPDLTLYPLGEKVERSIKKMVISLIEKKNDSNEFELSDNGIVKSFKKSNCEELFKEFLTHYLFEISIDYLRRPKAFCSEFNFQKKVIKENGVTRKQFSVRSIKAENSYRENLLEKCRSIAVDFSPIFLSEGCEKEYAEKVIQQIKQSGINISALKKELSEAEKNVENTCVNIFDGGIPKDNYDTSLLFNKNVRQFGIHKEVPNVDFSFKNESDSKEAPPESEQVFDSLIQDLIDIGVAVYMSDIYSERRHDLQRNFEIIIPVRNLDDWNPFKRKLESTISLLGRDNVSIYFVQKETKKDEQKVKQIIDFNEKNHQNRCVCLFSGGLDSLAGVKWALKEHKKPILISHYSNPKLLSIQNTLVEKLKELKIGKVHYCYFKVAKSRNKKVSYPLPSPPWSLMPQFLRSFLFLSLACAVALKNKISNVYMFENGPVALNPMFSEARINTMTTHPHFLKSFQSIINSVFEKDSYKPVCIENPFKYETKGQIVEKYLNQKFKELIMETNSCWNYARVPRIAKLSKNELEVKRHDGVCLPCIIRRVALQKVGMNNASHYLSNVFGCIENEDITKCNKELTLTIADYLRFCQNIRSKNDIELLLFAPDFSVYEDGINPPELIQMFKSHAIEFIDCFKNASNNKFRNVFGNILESEENKL